MIEGRVMSVSIMVVDDEPDVAELFRQRFRREVRQGQYVMHFAASAEEALGKLDDGVRPELIVMLSDINMPGMDGLGLLQEVKRRNAQLPSWSRPMATTSAAARPVNTVPPSSSPSRSTSTTLSANSSNSPRVRSRPMDVRFWPISDQTLHIGNVRNSPESRSSDAFGF